MSFMNIASIVILLLFLIDLAYSFGISKTSEDKIGLLMLFIAFLFIVITLILDVKFIGI